MFAWLMSPQGLINIQRHIRHQIFIISLLYQTCEEPYYYLNRLLCGKVNKRRVFCQSPPKNREWRSNVKETKQRNKKKNCNMILFEITGWYNHWHVTIHHPLIVLTVYLAKLPFTTFLTFYFVTFLQSDSQERCDLSNGNTQQLSAVGHHPRYGRRRSHRRGLSEEGSHTWKKASPRPCRTQTRTA